jgi:radical SAM superfamily enzyme YgiQ (UPF0313 family)
MLASRGCNGTCLYCYKMYGKHIRLRDPARVVDEIQYYVRHYGAREIKFWDEQFTYSHRHTYRFCEEMIRRGVNVRWWCSCRADAVDKRILRAMKAAGCWCINFGVESGVQKNQDTLIKHATLERSKLPSARPQCGSRPIPHTSSESPGRHSRKGWKPYGSPEVWEASPWSSSP